MSDLLDDFLSLAENDEDSYYTCKENQTINQTQNTINDTYFTTTLDTSNTLDSITEDPEEFDHDDMPIFKELSDNPCDNRLTLTEHEARTICNLPPASKTATPIIRKASLFPNSLQTCDDSEKIKLDSGSDDDELYEKQELNKSGKDIRKILSQEDQKQQASFISKSLTVKSSKPCENISMPQLGLVKTVVKPSYSAFDSFFALKIKEPKVSSDAFENLVEGIKKIKLMQLHSHKSLTESFVTMGVICEKGEVKKSANGNEYLIWKLHDLKNCQDKPVKLLLFGDACKDFWKLRDGEAIALLTPQFAEGNAKDGLTIKISRKTQIIDLGQCINYGHCKSTCQNGSPCTNFVNTESSDYCVYHVTSAARKLSSRRGVFNNVSAVQGKNSLPHGLIVHKPLYKTGNPTIINSTGTMKTVAGIVAKPIVGKTITKSEEKEKLKEIMSDRATLPGARNLQRFENIKTNIVEKKESRQVFSSMSTFIQKQEDAKLNAIVNRPPKLGFGLTGGSINLGVVGQKDRLNHAAKVRAAAILQRTKEENTRGVKRPSDQGTDTGTPMKQHKGLKAITDPEAIAKLLKTKSQYNDDIKKEERAVEEQYFNGMAAKEKIETFTTECMSVKNANVVTCKKCKYTAPSQSEYCKQQGHCIQRHTVEKRFFKCGSCSKRTVSYGIVPTEACKHCESTDWKRVAMKDERKVTLEQEKLQLRGEERKFVNI